MNVGAGIYLRDDGYVLGIKGDSAHYFQMPDAAKVAQLQRAGLLPDPLPAYRLGAFDYLMGYSLWIILAIIILYYGIRGRFRARRRAAAMAASAAPGDGMSRSLEMGRKAD